MLLASLFGMYPFLKKLFADAAYQGPEFHKALTKALPHLETEIVKRSDQAKGFIVLPKRWIVERTIACALQGCEIRYRGWRATPRARSDQVVKEVDQQKKTLAIVVGCGVCNTGAAPRCLGSVAFAGWRTTRSKHTLLGCLTGG